MTEFLEPEDLDTAREFVVEHGQHLIDEGPDILNWVVDNSEKEIQNEQAGRDAFLHPVDTYHEVFDGPTPDPAPTMDMPPSPEDTDMHIESD
jgi:hypothetical protein